MVPWLIGSMVDYTNNSMVPLFSGPWSNGNERLPNYLKYERRGAADKNMFVERICITIADIANFVEGRVRQRYKPDDRTTKSKCDTNKIYKLSNKATTREM